MSSVPTWTSGTTYAIGTVVKNPNDGKYYRNKDANPHSSWHSEYFGEVSVLANTSAINAINSTLDGDSSATNATLNTTYVSSGSSSCRYYKRSGWCYVEMYEITFKSSLYAIGAVTGLPKSKLYSRAGFNGSDPTNSAEISQKGDCCWIDPNGTTIYFFIDSNTYSLHHYTSFSYPLHEDEL